MPKRLFALGCCLSYFAIAFYTTSMGSAAAAMMAHWRIDSTAQGLILTAQSVGGILLAALFLFLGGRVPKARALLLGLSALLAAYLAMAALPGLTPAYGALLAVALPAGLGVTAVDVMVNGVVVDVFRERSGTILPFAHGTYSVGSTLAPLAATLLIDPARPESYGWLFLAGGAVCCIALLLAAFSSAPLKRAGVFAPRKEQRAAGGAILREPRAWLYLISGLFYFCFLWGVTAWLPSYCESAAGFDYRTSNFVLSAFFLGALIMRFLSPLLFKRMPPKRVFLLSTALSAAFLLLAVLLPAGGMILPLAVLSGFSQGTVVVCLVMMCCAAFPEDTAGASSIAVLAGTLGMFIAPFVMGVFSDRFDFRIAMLFAIACMPVAFAIIAVAEKGKREQ